MKEEKYRRNLFKWKARKFTYIDLTKNEVTFAFFKTRFIAVIYTPSDHL